MSQTLQQRGEHNQTITHSPYGGSRNHLYGWVNQEKNKMASFFTPRLVGDDATVQFSAYDPEHPSIYIGTSSLNSVPGKRRTFKDLFDVYQTKFRSLEHCYPYHREGTREQWASWKSAVSVTPAAAATPPPKLDDPSIFAGGVPPPTSTGDPVFVVPQDLFSFTVKANKTLTHERQLRIEGDPEALQHVNHFFNVLCRELDPHLGPILLQLPPSFQRTEETMNRLRFFERALPKDKIILVYPVPSASSPTPSYSWVHRRRIRIAVEFRHRSWYHRDSFQFCRDAGWAIVTSDLGYDEKSVSSSAAANNFSYHVDTGVPFMYCRLHGSLAPYAGDYGSLALQRWARCISGFTSASGEGRAAAPREVFCYLNNNDSNVAGVTSSTVDAACLAHLFRKSHRPLLPQEADGEGERVVCPEPIYDPLDDDDVRLCSVSLRRQRSPSVTISDSDE